MLAFFYALFTDIFIAVAEKPFYAHTCGCSFGTDLNINRIKYFVMKRKWAKRIPFIILIAVAAAFAFSAVVMLLWNAVLVSVLHVGAITLWQAMGILVLAKILFGGFRGRRHPGHHFAKHMCRKWENMTPEQREKFRNRMQQRMGNWQMRENPNPSA